LTYQKNAEAALDAAEKELLELAQGIELEEMLTVAEQGAGDKENREENDNLEG
jgi:hypothetical protein